MMYNKTLTGLYLLIDLPNQFDYFIQYRELLIYSF
jgi:hypothetical protein